MLSNPPPSASNLHSRQRLHRRQNSTPTAFEAVKIAPLPNYRVSNDQAHQQQQRQQQQRSRVSHRRGMSLDTRRLQLQPASSSGATGSTATTRQDYSPVSTPTTNDQGLSTTPQHVMRDTQQQRTARPGPSQPATSYPNHNRRNDAISVPRHTNNLSRSSCHSRGSSTSSIGSINHFGIDENSNYLLSPHGTPQRQRFVNAMPSTRQVEDMSMSFGPYLEQMSSLVQKSQQGYDGAAGQDFELYGADSALPTPTFLTFAEVSPSQSPNQGWMSEGETTNSCRSSRRISNGILDRVAKFESMGPEPIQVGRPYTPPGQNDNTYYPPTPMETPHDRTMKRGQPRPNRFSDDYDESLEETIKPVRGNRPQRGTDVFEQMRQQAEAMAQQQSGHQRTNAVPTSYVDSGMSAADFLDMSDMDQYVKIEGDFDELSAGSLDTTRRDSPPMHPHMTAFTMDGAFDHHKPSLQAHDSQDTVRAGRSPTRSSRRGSPHRRTESLASIVSAASISSINIEETKTDTGVTLDEIQMYIEGPDAEAKWTCAYEQCGKKFGRKENIKSHVQTHLNDRQYQCPTCKKCFVRQHDLKRHAKIHTGIKPYPCECGNSFARHDALTRHRQRGMCIGAFDGIVRKVVKRGRPRKYRPDMEDRLEKSERTRRKNKAAADAGRYTSTPSSASSQSGYSDCSAANSPANDNDFFDGAPLQDMDMLDVVGAPATTTLDLHAHNLPPRPASRPTSSKTMSPAAISSAFMPTSTSSSDDTTTTSTTTTPNHYDITSVSPEEITAAAPSPSTSTHSFHGLPTLPHQFANPPASPAKSTTSTHTHTPPPGLSASSSPLPCITSAADAPPFFDLDEADHHAFDANVSGLSDHSIGLGTTVAAHAAACGGADGGFGGVSEDDMFQQLMMGGEKYKYFDDVDEVALFNAGEDVDVFFGSS